MTLAVTWGRLDLQDISTFGIISGIELFAAGVIVSIELVFEQIIVWTIMGEPFKIGACLMMISAIVSLKSPQ